MTGFDETANMTSAFALIDPTFSESSFPEASFDSELEVELELFYELEADLEIEMELLYRFDPELEVELELVDDTQPIDYVDPLDVTGTDAALDDEWFGSFDDTQPIDFIDDEPTTPWRRFSTWVRNFKRAA